MPSIGGGAKIVGLADLQRELRAVDRELPRQLRVVNLKAAELVAADARSRATLQGGALGKAASSIKAMAQQRSASVRIGGNAYPFALGGEFGSVQFHQFPAWRGNGAGAGYALFPAKRAKTPQVIDMYMEMVGEVTRKAFPD